MQLYAAYIIKNVDKLKMFLTLFVENIMAPCMPTIGKDSTFTIQ